MQAMKFNDAETATNALGTFNRKWIRITRQFSELSEYWGDVATTHLSKIVTVDAIDDGNQRFTASTLGKKFTVELMPRIVNDELYGRVLIYTPNPLNSTNLLAGEFLMSENGKILSVDGTEIFDRHATSTGDYQLFCEVIRVAMAA